MCALQDTFHFKLKATVIGRTSSPRNAQPDERTTELFWTLNTCKVEKLVSNGSSKRYHIINFMWFVTAVDFVYRVKDELS